MQGHGEQGSGLDLASARQWEQGPEKCPWRTAVQEVCARQL